MPFFPPLGLLASAIGSQLDVPFLSVSVVLPPSFVVLVLDEGSREEVVDVISGWLWAAVVNLFAGAFEEEFFFAACDYCFLGF
ncbi:hypothetical protein AtNW77_Chr3g0184431 [Arabidopsis thaliana]